jgi:hypothetical protein
MRTVLIVVEPFKDYAKGDAIEDPQTVADVLASDQAHHVVKTLRPDLPAGK